VGLVGLNRDITDRKRSDEELSHERNLLRTLIDLIPDRIYVKDRESRFVLANNAMARRAGMATPEQLLGKSDLDLFPSANATQYFHDEQGIMRSGQPIINKEEAAVAADGRPIGQWHSFYFCFSSRKNRRQQSLDTSA
jgi:PAS domain S-box-containing protein